LPEPRRQDDAIGRRHHEHQRFGRDLDLRERRAAPLMGEDNNYVYREVLGLKPEEIAALKEDWVI